MLWCCQAHFNISKAATLMRQRECRPSLMGVRLSMLRCRAVESFIILLFFFMLTCSLMHLGAGSAAETLKWVAHVLHQPREVYIFKHMLWLQRTMCVLGNKHSSGTCVWVKVKMGADVDWACNSSAALHQQFMICAEVLGVLMISLPLYHNNFTKLAKH